MHDQKCRDGDKRGHKQDGHNNYGRNNDRRPGRGQRLAVLGVHKVDKDMGDDAPIADRPWPSALHDRQSSGPRRALCS